MDKRISHLSESQVMELMERYYRGERVSNLISEYKIDVSPGHLVRLFPPKATDKLCEFCEKKLTIKRLSRYYKEEYESASCALCKHAVGGKRKCECANCLLQERERQQKAINEKKGKIKDMFKIDYSDVKSIQSLNMMDMIQLATFFQGISNENQNTINPIETFPKPITPTVDLVALKTFAKKKDMDISEAVRQAIRAMMQKELIIDSLVNKDIILIHPDSDPNCFPEITNDGRYNYYQDKVKWFLNVVQGENETLLQLEHLISTISKIMDAENAMIIWRFISFCEALEYLQFKIKEIFNFNYACGQKTELVINELIDKYSVSEIYAIFYMSISYALMRKKERNLPSKHASNLVIGRAEVIADRYSKEKRKLIKYNRIKDLPQSELSSLFFYQILKIGEDGFYQKPSLNICIEKLKKEPI